MKYSLLLLTALFIQTHGSGQPYVNTFNDSNFVKQNKIRSYKEYSKDADGIKRGLFALTFDKNGKVIDFKDVVEDNAEPVRGFASYSYDVDSTDTTGLVIETKHYSDGSLVYVEQHKYNDKGLRTHTFGTEEGHSPVINMAASYDENGNLIEIFNPGYNVDRVIRTYNTNNQIVLKKSYKLYTELYRIDSNVYNQAGSKTATYKYEYRNGQCVLTDKYTAIYDDFENRVADSIWGTRSHELQLQHTHSYTFDDKNQLISEVFYDHFSNPGYPEAKKTIKYNNRGLRRKKWVYHAGSGYPSCKKLFLKSVTTYEYSYY